MELGLDSLLHS